MPPSLAAWIGKGIPEHAFMGDIPWTPLRKPLAEITFALMTSAGISIKTDPPFDMLRERREPTWGDPGYRAIPREAGAADVEVNHLHITTAFIKEDLNVILPLARFRELEKGGRIGRLAPTNYSYYGYQPDPTVLLKESMPHVARRMHAEGVEAVFLTPA
ncbi:MAG: hypothetical protein HZB24_13850 [Desulfobacterales bacterium]|nr:hypothetical protein [Desulfobacterales bacterium]